MKLIKERIKQLDQSINFLFRFETSFSKNIEKLIEKRDATEELQGQWKKLVNNLPYEQVTL